MYEHLASFLGGPPNENHFQLYSEWAKYEWGMIITGNAQISRHHLSLGRDVVLPKSDSREELLRPFRRLSDCIHGHYDRDGKKATNNNNNILAIMQINHGGRQSANFIGGRPPFCPPRAPSPIAIGFGSNPSLVSKTINSLMFQTPKEMSETEVQAVIEEFVDGALLAYKTGFDGIQLHAAHGCLSTFDFVIEYYHLSLSTDLLSQFLSPKVRSSRALISVNPMNLTFRQLNTRVDRFSYDNSLEIIHTIVQRIRLSTAKTFVICIKINSADYISSDTSGAYNTVDDAEMVALNHILAMSEWGLIDVIEISGGDYESPGRCLASVRFCTTSNHNTRRFHENSR